MSEKLNWKKETCRECGFKAHFLQVHIEKEHGLSIEDYQKKFEGAEVMSPAAKSKLAELESQSKNEKVMFNIEKTFGIKVGKVKEIEGWKYPHERTPELDPDYHFRKEPLQVVLLSLMDKGERVLFTGPTGSGKTSVIEQVCARLNLPAYRVQFDNEISRSDFVGQWTLKGESMEYQWGILPKSIMEESVLIIDEWDCANPGIAMLLQAVLEGKPFVSTDTGDVIKLTEGWRIFGTANTVGQGDETGMYNGTQPQNFAQLDRWTMCEVVDYPTADVETDILRKKCNLTDEALKARFGVAELKPSDNSASIIKNLLAVANLMREAFKKEEVSATMSTRTIVNIGNKLQTFGNVKRAYKLAYTNKLNTEDRNFAEEIIQRVWGK